MSLKRVRFLDVKIFYFYLLLIYLYIRSPILSENYKEVQSTNLEI